MGRARRRAGLARLRDRLAEAAVRTDGAAILEFALVLPLLVALIFGCVELGRALLVREAMTASLRAGARMLARQPDPWCRPACAPAALRVVDATAETIARAAGLPQRAIRVRVLDPSPDGSVGLRAEVELATELLERLGLSRALALRETRYEARLAR